MSILGVDDVWKRFKIPHEKNATVLDQIASAILVFEGKRYSYEEFWALKNVDFTVERGESLGIVGPNGSGKTTLLKLIAGILIPDKGVITRNESIAPVLELGVGFHGDLSVKENIAVYGVIMGLKRAEMKKRTESVLDFAGLSRFRDAKLKTLSSGMQVRLAFSIAVQTDAHILLVDEALAVGDMKFREKCLQKFCEFKDEDKSIIMVSHNMGLVKSFCEKTLYLLDGEMRAFGSSEEATSQYLEDLGAAVAQNHLQKGQVIT